MEVTVDQTPYVDFRVQAVDRMRRMMSRFVINAWEQRFSDPIAPHTLAYLYWRHNPRRPGFWQLGTAWQLWLAHPDVRVLPQLLFSLHQQLAPRAAGAGFDVRDELAIGRDPHMELGTADWVYAGLAVISLDTSTGTWEDVQQTGTAPTDVPAVARVVLTDGSVMVCQQRSRSHFSDFTVESTAALKHGTVRVLADWAYTELQDLRQRDPEILRWAKELSDTLSQADNGRIDALRQAARSHAYRPRGTQP